MDVPPGFPNVPLDHGNRSGLMVAIDIVCIALPTLATALRFYARQFIIRQVGVDDWIALVALASVIVLAAIQITHTHFGLGHHIWDVITVPGLFADFMKYFVLANVLYNVGLLFIKLTFFFQYWRIMLQVDVYRKVYAGIMALVVMWTVAQIFVMIFICGGGQNIMNKSCDPIAPTYVNAIGNMVTDVIILLLPMPMIFRLKLRRSQKWGLAAMFGLGFFTCLISILRLVYLNVVSTDFTFDAVTLSSWSMAELAVGLICACLPSLRALLVHWFPTFMGTELSSRYNRQGYQRSSDPKQKKSVSGHSRSNATGTTSQTDLCVDDDIELESGVRSASGPDLDKDLPGAPPKAHIDSQLERAPQEVGSH
ncbi:hypothetical protein JX265_007767 [Neoarthrinium moseri]|uniref:Rhodopsin domain-containing protein n=1 Tax=Neoarthrinium moseri TaxID=1658444 RepID=A0A9Q0APD6_9PEZI|nr:uncharacterized protein JN550_003345 [Neoarthrinium moseri]KAI1866466.1 hypothetical protein JX265_007767 [Neoarthrinium moseri]KAI1873092.1 hypothetical protein JN550_003345 [Neoarthrinium moseri]